MWLVLLGTCPYFLLYILWPFLVNFIGWTWYIYSVNSSSVSMVRACAKGGPPFKATMSGGHLTRKTPSPYTPEAIVPPSTRYQYILTNHSLFKAYLGSLGRQSHIREMSYVMTKNEKFFWWPQIKSVIIFVIFMTKERIQRSFRENGWLVGEKGNFLA